MKNVCWRNIGIILMFFGAGIILCLVFPIKFLVFLLTALIIYIGFLFFKL